MRTPSLTVIVVALVVSGTLVPVTAVSLDSGPAVRDAATTPREITAVESPLAATGAAGTAAPETDDTITRIDLSSNGSAVWEISYRTRLETDTEADEYRSFQDQFRNDTERYVAAFRDRIGDVIAGAENATGREMGLVNVSASTSIQQVPRRWGVVTYRFRWLGFAQQTTDGLRSGDVFDGGFYLAANDTLIVTAPPEYQIDDTDPSPDSSDAGQVRWTGQQSFADGRPLVVASEPTPTATATATETVTPTATETPTATAPPTTDTPTGPPDDPDEGSGMPFGLVALVAVILAAGAAVAYRTGYVGGTATDIGSPDGGDGAAGAAAATDDDGDDDGPGGTGGSSTDDGDASGIEPEGGPAVTGGGAASGGAAGGDGAEAPADPATDEAVARATADAEPETDEDDPYVAVLDDIRPPLTDEDRVRKALAEDDGRMRQAALAEQLDWSASKTSRVLSGMADDETIEKIRVGRENVVDLVLDDE